VTRKARLMATLRGEAVDRPPVSFYELNGLDEDPGNKDPFNITTPVIEAEAALGDKGIWKRDRALR